MLCSCCCCCYSYVFGMLSTHTHNSHNCFRCNLVQNDHQGPLSLSLFLHLLNGLFVWLLLLLLLCIHFVKCNGRRAGVMLLLYNMLLKQKKKINISSFNFYMHLFTHLTASSWQTNIPVIYEVNCCWYAHFNFKPSRINCHKFNAQLSH